MSKSEFNEFHLAVLGHYGFAEVNSVNTVGADERFIAVEILEDGTTWTATADSPNLNGSENCVVSVNITGDKADKIVYGLFDNLAVSAGSVRAYYSDEVDRSGA